MHQAMIDQNRFNAMKFVCELINQKELNLAIVTNFLYSYLAHWKRVKHKIVMSKINTVKGKYLQFIFLSFKRSFFTEAIQSF